MTRPRPARRQRRPLSRAQRYARAPRPPAAVELAYAIAMGKVAQKWAARVRAALTGRLGDFAKRTDADDADGALSGISLDLGTLRGASSGIVDKAIRHSKNEFGRVGIPLDEDHEPDLAGLTRDWRKASAERAERIFANERDTIVELLRSSENRTPEQLQDRIDERLEVTKSKIDAAARDDILTLNGKVNEARQTAAGITEFTWTTAGDERVRESHKEVDGKTFRWDDPPVVDDEEAIPGEPHNCRCVPFPVLDELGDETDEEQAPAPEAQPSGEAPDEERVAANPLLERADDFVRSLDLGDGGKEARAILEEEVQAFAPGSASQGSHRGQLDVEVMRPGVAAYCEPSHGSRPGRIATSRECLRSAKQGIRRIQGGVDFSTATRAELHEVDSVSTLVHEQLHSHSRVSGYSYRSEGRAAEEIGTELSARHIVDKMAPGFARAISPTGAYNDWIRPVRDVVARALNVSEPEAELRIAKAHTESALASGPRFTSPESAANALIDSLGVSPHWRGAILRELRNCR